MTQLTLMNHLTTPDIIQRPNRNEVEVFIVRISNEATCMQLSENKYEAKRA